MKSTSFLATVLCLFLYGTYCSLLPAQNFQWAKRFGGTQNETATCTAFDSQGNVFIVGTFSGTADFDPGAATFNMTALGFTDIYVVKLNAIGDLIWAKQMGGTSNDYVQGLAVDGAGNPHITGHFYQMADFDPSAGTVAFTAMASSDVYVVKLDGNGNLIWAKQFAGNDLDRGWALTVDGSGNVYTTGDFTYTCDFDPGAATFNVTANGTISDVFVSKLDVNGNFVWAKRLGGPWSEFGYAIKVNTASEVIVVGNFEGTADFDPGTGTFNMTTIAYNPDAFICKLSSAGALVWAKGVGNSGFDYGQGLDLDASGNIYVSGNFGFTVDFDPNGGTFNMTAAGSYDAYLLKLSSAGNFVWAKQIGGTGTAENARSLSVTPTSVYYTGLFDGTADFNPNAGTNNLTALGTQDAYVGQLDLNGNYVSAFRIGAVSSFTSGYHVKADAAGNVYTIGGFQGAPDFDPGAGTTIMTSAGQGDAWIQKLSLCTNTASTFSASACSSYTLGNQTYTSSGNYVTRIPNAAGCDSVVTLNLTIRQPSAATLNQTVCGTSFTLNSQTYSSSGTYVQTLTNAVGCDSTLTLNLVLNSATSATLNQTACGTSFTLNSQTYTSSGTYVQTLTNAMGCDSTLTLNLVLNVATSATLNHSTCDSSFTLNSQTYTSSGTYVQTLTNAAGCDSTLTLNLVLNSATGSTVNHTTCDSSFTLNSQTYTNSGVYFQTLTNAAGCDSTLTLNLVLNQATSETVTASVCESYALNSQTYTTSGTYTQTLTNVSGCDSTLTLILTVSTTPVATINQSNGTLNAGPSGLTYQWVDCDNGMMPIPGATGATFTPSVSGNYAVIVMDGPCADTSACAPFTVLGVEPDWAQEVRLYPNPSSGYCVIDLGMTMENVSVTVVDILGKEMQTLHFVNARTLPLHLDVPQGVYGVHITTELGTVMLKLVDQN